MKTINIQAPLIATAADHEEALAHIKSLLGAEQSPETDAELSAYVDAVETYETENFPIASVEPLEIIFFRMAQLQISKQDLAEKTGLDLSDAFNDQGGFEELTVRDLKTISEALNISPKLLL